MGYRELTRQEKTAIRKLVVQWCANYDRDTGCLPLDCGCYMLGKIWTGPMCRYFRQAVLPLDPALEQALAQEDVVLERRVCPLVWQVLCPQAAAALLLPGLSGRGQPQEVPCPDAEQARKRRVQVLRFKPPKAL